MPLFIPSPSISSFQLGPLTIHIYALCLITGIIAAWTIGLRRWQARGGNAESFETILLWAIPIGILGARFYHVLTHLGDYFAPGINPWSVFFIWEGGIAIYGAVGFGALAAWLAARHRKVSFPALADSLAPAIAVGQAIGRFGNWFNQELYGLPTDVPWALEIDPAHRAPGFEQYPTFHPTFLYESIWNLFVAGVLLWCDRRFKLGRGKVFALYIALYGLGRTFTESIRLDYSYDVFGPIRFNAAVAILICLTGIALFIWLSKFRPGRETQVEFGAGAGARRAAGPLAEPDSDDQPDEVESGQVPGAEEGGEAAAPEEPSGFGTPGAGAVPFAEIPTAEALEPTIEPESSQPDPQDPAEPVVEANQPAADGSSAALEAGPVGRTADLADPDGELEPADQTLAEVVAASGPATAAVPDAAAGAESDPLEPAAADEPDPDQES